uniref:Uncharacterized protein n=1 Tax=Magallana gigas TaxID=29159 RepID=K1R1U5_MAGGI
MIELIVKRKVSLISSGKHWIQVVFLMLQPTLTSCLRSSVTTEVTRRKPTGQVPVYVPRVKTIMSHES